MPVLGSQQEWLSGAPVGLRGGHCLQVQDTCRRRGFQGGTRFITRFLGQEAKAGKGVDRGDFRGSKHGKIKGYGY